MARVSGATNRVKRSTINQDDDTILGNLRPGVASFGVFVILHLLPDQLPHSSILVGLVWQ